MAAGPAPDLELAEVVKAGIKKICTGTIFFQLPPRPCRRGQSWRQENLHMYKKKLFYTKKII
jgi:hypothetical protein